MNIISISILTVLLPFSLLAKAKPQAPAADPKPSAKQSVKHSFVAREQQRQRKLNEQLKIDGDNRFRYAKMLFLEGRYERAQELWEYFVALYLGHPKDVEAMRYLAIIAEKQQRFAYALAGYMAAYQQDPEHRQGVYAFLQAGRLSEQLGDITEGNRIFQVIIKENKFADITQMARLELKRLAVKNGDKTYRRDR